MGTLDVGQRKALAAKAGFTGSALDTIVAISMGELNVATDIATNSEPNTDGSIDRGWLQINSVHHDVSDACAHDPLCAAQAAYRISSGGKNFRPWSVFTSGAYERYLPQVMSTDPRDVGGDGVSAGDVARNVLDGIVPGGSFLAPIVGKVGDVAGGAAGAIAGPVVDAVQSVFERAAGDVAHAALATVFVIGALGLIVAGVWQAVAPRVRERAQTAESLAPLVAAL